MKPAPRNRVEIFNEAGVIATLPTYRSVAEVTEVIDLKALRAGPGVGWRYVDADGRVAAEVRNTEAGLQGPASNRRWSQRLSLPRRTIR